MLHVTARRAYDLVSRLHPETTKDRLREYASILGYQSSKYSEYYSSFKLTRDVAMDFWPSGALFLSQDLENEVEEDTTTLEAYLTDNCCSILRLCERWLSPPYLTMEGP